MEYKDIIVHKDNADTILLMNYLGYVLVEMGYWGDKDSETPWQRQNADLTDKLDMDSVGFYFLKISTEVTFYLHKDDFSKHIDFKKDWQWLMQVAKKLEFKSIPTNIVKAYELLLSRVKVSTPPKILLKVGDIVSVEPSQMYFEIKLMNYFERKATIELADIYPDKEAPMIVNVDILKKISSR